MKIYNIHRLAVPADRRPVWAGDGFTPARASFNGDSGWWNGQQHNMAVPVWSVTEILSFSLSLSFSLIHAYMCLTVSRRSRDLRSLSPDRSVTFHKNFPNCLKRPKNVVWQSADGRVTTDHCHVAIQWLFSKFLLIAWNVQKTLFDSRPTVAWPPTTVAWLFSDFFQKISNCLKRPWNVVWQSADGRVTSDHCRVTVQWLFKKNFQIACLKHPKNVVWQSADGRVTSDHCRVTVQWLFSKNFLIAWNVQKTLFDNRPTVAWPPTTVTWPFSDFFQNFSWLLETYKKRCFTVGRRSRDHRPLSRDRSATFFKKFPNCLKRPKNVVWQSADGRVTSDRSRLTVQWLFSMFFLIAWNVQKSLFDSRPTVSWLPTTVPWPFSDFFKIFPNCLKRPKTVFDCRPTVAWPPTTVAWPYSDLSQKFSRLLETSKKFCLTVGRRSRANPTTVAWPYSDFF